MTDGIALLGCGTVGGAVAEMLVHESDHLRFRSGRSLRLRHILVRHPDRPRDKRLPAKLFKTTFDEILADKSTHIVVEVMGGVDPARQMILRALAASKHVVTANKHLLALHGDEIFAAAAKAKRCVGFEASCGGAIPIVGALSRGLLANDITRVIGIVNGTCNYILTQMYQQKRSFADALAEAQAAGFAETDPTLDINGTDSAHKLAVIAALAFGVHIQFDRMEISGIDRLRDIDLRYALELGYVCKLLAIAEKMDGAISLRVHPALIPKNQLLANVNGPFNAIGVLGHASGETIYYGRGAGPRPTASAVLADILDVALGTLPALFAQLPSFGRREPANLMPIGSIRCRHYLRMTALDVPGVMAQVTRILGRNDISLSAIVQHEACAGEYVPVVIMTHEARDDAVAAAVRQIDALKAIKGDTVRLRVSE